MKPEAHEKDWWIGPEVEGQIAHTRAHAAIIRRPPVVGALQAQKVEHIFLTEDFDHWGWLEMFAGVFRGTMAIGVHHHDVERLATINKLACRRRLRVLLRFFADDASTVRMLYAHDEVSVGAPFDLLTFPVPAGVRTYPDQYKGDQ